MPQAVQAYVDTNNPAAAADRAVVRELISSRTVAVCFHANEPGPGLAASVDLTKFTLFLADTGLFVTAAFRDRSFTDNDIYRRLLATSPSLIWATSMKTRLRRCSQLVATSSTITR